MINSVKFKDNSHLIKPQMFFVSLMIYKNCNTSNVFLRDYFRIICLSPMSLHTNLTSKLIFDQIEVPIILPVQLNIQACISHQYGMNLPVLGYILHFIFNITVSHINIAETSATTISTATTSTSTATAPPLPPSAQQQLLL